MSDLGDPASPAFSHRRFALVYAALFLALGVVTPYLQVLLRLRGFARDQIGLILGVLEIMAVLAPPLWGYLGDHTGRPRRILTVAILGSMSAFLCFGWASSFVSALVVAVLFGIFYKPLIPLTDGLTFRHIRMSRGDYGKARVAGSFAFILSIVLLEVLGVARSAKGGMIIAAVLLASVVHLASMRALPPDDAGADAAQADGTCQRARIDLRLFLRRGFICFALAALLGRIAMMSYYGFFSLYLKEYLGVEQAGYVWIIGPISEIPMIYFSRRIMERIGIRNLFALGMAGIALRLLGFGLASSVWWVLPMQLLHALTFGAVHTASVTYVSRCVPVHMNGTAQTLFSAVTYGVGGLLGGAIGGQVAEHCGFSTLYLSFSGVAFVGLLIAVFAVPHADADGRVVA